MAVPFSLREPERAESRRDDVSRVLADKKNGRVRLLMEMADRRDIMGL